MSLNLQKLGLGYKVYFFKKIFHKNKNINNLNFYN